MYYKFGELFRFRGRKKFVEGRVTRPLWILSVVVLILAMSMFVFLGVRKVVRTIHSRQVTAAHLAGPVVPTVKNYGYTMQTFSSGGASLPYFLYMPDHYNPAKKYPMVLILHGGGERSDPKKTLAQNQTAILRNSYVRVWTSQYVGANNPDIQQHWPSFVVVPQIQLSQQWVNVSVHQGPYVQPKITTQMQLTKELLDNLQTRYSGIDANRIYVTGLSLGGYGTWDAIERWPGYFAAAAPVSGAGDPSKASLLAHLPIWAFHGSKDKTVPVSGSRAMIAAIKAAGGNPRYTEIEGSDHVIWQNVYYPTVEQQKQIPDFYSWLFSQHK
jgi:predicted peptidase